MNIIDRRKLYRAPWSNVLRLARSLGLRTPPGDCGCGRCTYTLIERIARACERACERADGVVGSPAMSSTVNETFAEEQEFTCPKCGSHRFGSFGPSGKMTRHCYGYKEGKNCTFSSPESADAKVFKGTGRMRQTTGLVGMATPLVGTAGPKLRLVR